MGRVDGAFPGTPAGEAAEPDPALDRWMTVAPEPGAVDRFVGPGRDYGPLRSHRATSLDHSVWFHHDGPLDGWLLYDQEGPVAADSRGLNFGRIFGGDGRLLASAAQEGMMRRG